MVDDDFEDEEVFDLSDAFGSNPKAEVVGVWKNLGGPARVKVARLGNKAARRAYNKIPKAQRDAFEEGLADAKQAEQFICDFLSKHILKDWEGLADKGSPVGDYSEEKGKRFLFKYRRFRERIWEIASDDDLFNVESEEDAKNSPELSTGISGTTKTPSKPYAVES